MEKQCGKSYNDSISEKPGTGPNIHADKAKVWSITWKKAGAENIPVLALPVLRVESLAWDGMKEALAAAISSAPALVIDLRGNVGGYDEGVRLAGEALYGQKPPLALKRTTFIRTPEAMALKVNYAELDVYYSSVAHSGNLIQFEYKARKVKAELENAVAGKQKPLIRNDFPQGPLEDNGKIFKKPVYLLVDRLCASACEIGVFYLRSLPNARTVGENTAGDLVSNLTSIAILPNSHVRVWLGDVYREFNEPVTDRAGLAPDIRTPKDADSLDFLLGQLAAGGAR